MLCVCVNLHDFIHTHTHTMLCFALLFFHQVGSFPVLLLLYMGHDLSSWVMSEGSVSAWTLMTHQHIWERWIHPWTRNSGQRRTPAWGGDITGSVNIHFLHLSEHVQYNTTWSCSLAVLLLLLLRLRNKIGLLCCAVNQQDWACLSEGDEVYPGIVRGNAR